MAARKKPTRPTPPSDATEHAHKIAEAVQTAWFGTYGSDRIEVPVSLVAVLSAAPKMDLHGADITDTMLTWSPDDFVDYAINVWQLVIQRRPETTQLLFPLISWWFDEIGAEMRRHVQIVARAALRAGQVDLTGTGRRLEVDLLGAVLTVLRPKAALKAHGQFYTPGSIATLLAHMTGLDEGGVVSDPMMGTGGMFRAAAEVMRQKGKDPSTMRWVGCDIDPLAVACATINSISWKLGHDIVFHVGNAFDPDWESAAIAQRDHLRAFAEQVRRHKYLLGLLNNEPEQ